MADQDDVASATSTKKEKENAIRLVVRSQLDEKETVVKVKPHVYLHKLMEVYCKMKKLDMNTVRFIFKEKRITKKLTPHKLKMKDGDQIDVMFEMNGGGTEKGSFVDRNASF